MPRHSLYDKPPFQVLLAPNAFKGSLNAPVICEILAEELECPSIHTVSLPLGDGGDGTAPIIASYLQARPVKTWACDALGRKKEVTYYTTEDTAIIELAAICGIRDLFPQEYDILNADTTGLGIVMLQVAEEGFRKILLCVGGSASIDGGLGALSSMGLKIAKSGIQYQNHLIELESIAPDELQHRFKDIELTILCDVSNPLCGMEGAASVFGPQKGASVTQINLLDKRLFSYAGLLLSITGKDVTVLKHGGAAGGIAASFAALLNAQLVAGADYCINLSGFKDYLKTSGAVITGEGWLDKQSLYGKIPGTIAQLCRTEGIRLFSIAGGMETNISPVFGTVFTLLDYAGNLSASLRSPEHYLRMVAHDIKKNILNLI